MSKKNQEFPTVVIIGVGGYKSWDKKLGQKGRQKSLVFNLYNVPGNNSEKLYNSQLS